MYEVNIFSYLQKSSSLYNLLKIYGKDLELQKKRNLGIQDEEIGKIREILQQLSLFELPQSIKLPRKIPTLKEILQYLAGIERERDPHKIREYVGKAAKLLKDLKVLDRIHLECVVKLSKNSLSECKKYLKELKDVYSWLGKSEMIRVKLIDRGLFGASQKFAKYLFEVGLEIDPYMNVPIIPASTIKGALRKAYETLQPKRGWPLPEKIFGSSRSPEGGGTIGAFIFTDGYPVEAGRGGYVLYPDVITPHYPADLMGELDHEPKPISHLSIAPETCFGFVVAYKREEITDEILRETIKLAIDMGIGARTSAGYGVFELVEGEK